MNHTSEDHEWAKRARAGEKEYLDRYFFFDNMIFLLYMRTTAHRYFPTTAPGNFTWLEDLHKHVMTTFYPYQWDLNYRNPIVFNEMIYNMLYLANQGVILSVSMQFHISGNSLEPTAVICHRYTPLFV